MTRIHKPDFVLFACILALTAFGLIMLASASGPSAFEKFGSNFYFVKHQIFYGLIPGLVLFAFFYKVDYHRLARFALPAFLIAALLLVIVLIPGIGDKIGTTKSWIVVGRLFSFQPAEFMKLAFILVSAWWLARAPHRHESQVPTARSRPLQTWRDIARYLVFPLIVAALLVAQPDVGTLIVFACLTAMMLIVAGIPWRYFAALAALGIAAFVALIFSAPYRSRRFMTFLYPEFDPQGIGYHINQALLAVGSGGLFGLGYGHSRQKYQYLPEVHADSIFAVIAEELGFVFVVIFVAFLVFMFLRGVKIAKLAPDVFGRLVAVGVITWFVGQSFINIASMIGLSPLTGLPLPFVSHGGTAMIISLAAAGILINISKQTRV